MLYGLRVQQKALGNTYLRIIHFLELFKDVKEPKASLSYLKKIYK